MFKNKIKLFKNKFISVRLSERNGDLGRGTLEIYKADLKVWKPACIGHWDSSTSPSAVCSLLGGYSSVNSIIDGTSPVNSLDLCAK